VDDLVETTSRNLKENGVQSVEDLQRLDHNVVTFSETFHRRNRQLKDFLYKNLYRHYRVVRMAVKAERLISELFSAYCQEPTILPHHVQQRVEKFGLQRTVCDYIAGMTDRYATEEYRKLFNAETLP